MKAHESNLQLFRLRSWKAFSRLHSCLVTKFNISTIICIKKLGRNQVLFDTRWTILYLKSKQNEYRTTSRTNTLWDVLYLLCIEAKVCDNCEFIEIFVCLPSWQKKILEKARQKKEETFTSIYSSHEVFENNASNCQL